MPLRIDRRRFMVVALSVVPAVAVRGCGSATVGDSGHSLRDIVLKSGFGSGASSRPCDCAPAPGATQRLAKGA